MNSVPARPAPEPSSPTSLSRYGPPSSRWERATSGPRTAGRSDMRNRLWRYSPKSASWNCGPMLSTWFSDSLRSLKFEHDATERSSRTVIDLMRVRLRVGRKSGAASAAQVPPNPDRSRVGAKAVVSRASSTIWMRLGEPHSRWTWAGSTATYSQRRDGPTSR